MSRNRSKEVERMENISEVFCTMPWKLLLE
jgi:hypothetical protein